MSRPDPISIGVRATLSAAIRERVGSAVKRVHCEGCDREQGRGARKQVEAGWLLGQPRFPWYA
jgi:hypothetical protein